MWSFLLVICNSVNERLSHFFTLVVVVFFLKNQVGVQILKVYVWVLPLLSLIFLICLKTKKITLSP